MNPTFENVLNAAIDSKLFDLHTCLPGIVESYDPSKNTVSVVPAIKRKYESGEIVTLPIINNVPVAFPRGSNFSMTFPIKKGDSVILVFSERSLDIWKKNGGLVDPKDPRRFNLTDAYAIPGGYPEKSPVPGASATKLRIKNNDSLIEMQEGAKFKIGKDGGDELFDLISQLIQGLMDAKTTTAIGPQPFWGLTQSKLSEIKGKIDALKG